MKVRKHATQREAKMASVEHTLDVLSQRVKGIPRTLRELNYSLQLLSVLRHRGWQQSLRLGKPIDRNGEPIPWYTDSALEWLGPRISAADTVFEYGAGHSTPWYSHRAKHVVSVEHDANWLEQVRPLVAAGTLLLHRPSSGTEASSQGESRYFRSIEEFPACSFDVIVIDGVERVQCAQVAPSRLRKGGIIVLDNSDWPILREAVEILHNYGFGRIDFYGFVPQVGTRNCTSIFSQFDSPKWTMANVPLEFQGW
jgi:hypothetical protein